ncbi:ABC transporter ATP-binding protein [Paenibacillus tundrae]|uniref:ATP-binding cassette domain-containing protein n=1 Tax=Paenibacillus TaxID=44249 RepID=UPI0009F9020D
MHSILGPNGCGKSTLLKALGKQIQTTAGEVLFKNSDINTWSRKTFARELAFLMQVHESNPEVTVRQPWTFFTSLRLLN